MPAYHRMTSCLMIVRRREGGTASRTILLPCEPRLQAFLMEEMSTRRLLGTLSDRKVFKADRTLPCLLHTILGPLDCRQTTDDAANYLRTLPQLTNKDQYES